MNERNDKTIHAPIPLNNVFLIKPSPRLVFYALFLSIAISLGLQWAFPGLAYFNRALYTILLTFTVVAIPTVAKNGWRISLKDLARIASPTIGYCALALGLSLLLIHVVLH